MTVQLDRRLTLYGVVSELARALRGKGVTPVEAARELLVRVLEDGTEDVATVAVGLALVDIAQSLREGR